MFLSPPVLADHLVVSKAKHTLTLYSHGAVLKTYNVALGRKPGAKEFQGDERTPEGHYVIDGHNPHSSFHVALHVSYPNAADRARAAAAHRPAGGDIMIHGLPPGAAAAGPLQHWADWTSGCVALSNARGRKRFTGWCRMGRRLILCLRLTCLTSWQIRRNQSRKKQETQARPGPGG